MWALNVTAQKGLVYGNMKLVMGTGEIINCNVAGSRSKLHFLLFAIENGKSEEAVFLIIS